MSADESAETAQRVGGRQYIAREHVEGLEPHVAAQVIALKVETALRALAGERADFTTLALTVGAPQPLDRLAATFGAPLVIHFSARVTPAPEPRPALRAVDPVE